MQSPSCTTAGAIGGACEGDAEDMQSCCFEALASRTTALSASCRACGGRDACVLLLPCWHLCLCLSCEPGVDSCPVCAAAKNASLHVLLSQSFRHHPSTQGKDVARSDCRQDATDRSLETVKEWRR
jgi:E3 ubiquitin-protein ligase BOI-like protein